MSRRKVEVFFSGVVQGVGFRYFVCQQAQDLGVVGLVRNLPDGRLMVTAEGDQEQLDTFINEIKPGPRSAVVEDVAVRWTMAEGRFTSFNMM